MAVGWRLSVAFSLAATILVAPVRAYADDPTHPQLRYDLALDVTTIGAGAAIFVAGEFAYKPTLQEAKCAWCEVGGLDASVRDAWRWSESYPASVASYVTALLTPLAGIALNAASARTEGSSWNDVGVDALIVTEAVAVSQVINESVKFIARRQRPHVHARQEAERVALADADDNLSFYSGHTSFAFTAAAASGTVASMRNYKLAPLVWSSGLTLATGTGYLRIAADRHYLTDVLTGAVVGSIIGVAMPYVFHRPSSRSTSDTGTSTLAPAAPRSVVGFTTAF